MLSEKTLADVLKDVWRAKLYMLGFVTVFIVLGFVYIRCATPYYQAHMIVAPAQAMGTDNTIYPDALEGAVRNYNDERARSNAFVFFENIYDGVAVARLLVTDEKIQNAVKQDRPLRWLEPKEQDLKAEELSNYFKTHIAFENLPSTRLRRIVYHHPERELAAYVVQRLHKVSDEIIRLHSLQDLKARIEYLNQALLQNMNPDHRQALTSLLIEQERTKMMASIDMPYAAQVIEPVSVSLRHKWPDYYLIFSVAILLGAFLGFVVSGVRNQNAAS